MLKTFGVGKFEEKSLYRESIIKFLDVTPRFEGRHVAIIACPLVGPSFTKTSQEPTKHPDNKVRLKNGNPT